MEDAWGWAEARKAVPRISNTLPQTGGPGMEGGVVQGPSDSYGVVPKLVSMAMAKGEKEATSALTGAGKAPAWYTPSVAAGTAEGMSSGLGAAGLATPAAVAPVVGEGVAAAAAPLAAAGLSAAAPWAVGVYGVGKLLKIW